ncbi:MAG: hypothetical protein JST68_25795 [Bacteroidetes bacterium]|nr:hypothetical protein [Bacteroidota bacterium]
MNQQAAAPGSLFQLILLLAFFVPSILFFLTQQNTLRLIRSENRELNPGLVWLQLIPLFNLYWIFVVVTRIADSISKENVAFQDDSILGVSGYDAVDAIGKRPTYKIGIVWCVLFVFNTLLYFGNVTERVSMERLLTLLRLLTVLGLMVCWIVYWVMLAQEKRKLKALRHVL